MAVRIGIVLRRLENQSQEVQNGDNQGAKSNRPKRESRCTNERGGCRMLRHFTWSFRAKVIPRTIRSTSKSCQGYIGNNLWSPKEGKTFEKDQASNLATRTVTGPACCRTGQNNVNRFKIWRTRASRCPPRVTERTSVIVQHKDSKEHTWQWPWKWTNFGKACQRFRDYAVCELSAYTDRAAWRNRAENATA